MTGDDHNTDALIAALRSPALPAERAGEAAAVSAMLGVIARTPASTRFRAGRGIAIAVVTVASLGVGGLAAAGPGVFQAAASKARSLITADSAESESSADAVTGDDPLGGVSPDGIAVDPGSVAALGAAASLPAGASVGAPCADTPGNVPATAQDVCGQPSTGSGPVTTGPPPECAEGNHGKAVSEVVSGSVPPSGEEALEDVAHDTCTPQDPQGNAVQGSNPNKPTEQPGNGNANGSVNGNGSANGNLSPGTANNGNQTGAGNGGVGVGNTPPATLPSQGNGNANGAANGAANGNSGTGSNNGQGPDTDNGKGAAPDSDNGKSGADATAPTGSVPGNNGKGSVNGNGNANGG